MKVFIAGASGFIGSSLVKAMAQAGHTVFALSRSLNKNFDDPRISEMSLPMTTMALSPLLKAQQPCVFIHCIGASTVLQAQDSPYESYLSSVNTVSESLEAIRVSSPNTHYIFISSASVYGEQEKERLSEDLSLRPYSVYGYHKCMAELLVQQYVKEFGINALIVRPFSVFGEGLRKQVIYDIAQKAIQKTAEIYIKGTGKERRVFVHIDDFVVSMIQFSLLRLTGVVNLGTGHATTIEEVAEFIKECLTPQSKLVFSGEVSSKNPFSLIADVSITHRLGLQPKVSVRTGVTRICQAITEGDYII